ncbi:MAG: hypothetical protein ACOYXS_05515 [Chloroflexota bacterium]
MSRRSSHGTRPHGQRPHRRDPQRPEAVARLAPERPDPLAHPAAVTVADEVALEESFASAFEPAPARPGPSITPSPASAPSVSPPAGARTSTGCTAAQLRRFIKSRAYVPMHELRRRFAINGAEDDVTWIDTANGRLFVGLPPREAQLLGELIRSGDVGVERSLDPVSPIVIGIYPMRPVTRT